MKLPVFVDVARKIPVRHAGVVNALENVPCLPITLQRQKAAHLRQKAAVLSKKKRQPKKLLKKNLCRLAMSVPLTATADVALLACVTIAGNAVAMAAAGQLGET